MIQIFLNASISRVRESVDQFGRLVSDETVGIRARVERSERIVTGPDGEPLQLSWEIYTSADADILPGDRIEIGGRYWPVQMVYTAEGFTPSHKEVLL